MGDEEGRGADLDLDAADLVAQLHAHLGVERRERLVEQEDRRLDRQRPGEGHPLLLAAGELVGVAVGVDAETDQLEHVVGPLAAGRAVATAQLEAEGDVVAHCQVREQAVGLEDHPHVALVGRHPGEVLAADLDAAGRRLVEAGQDAQCRGLAAARRAEQGHELAGGEMEGESVERADRAVDPGQVRQLNGQSGLACKGHLSFTPSAPMALLRLKNDSPSSSSDTKTIEAKAPAMAVDESDLLMAASRTGNVS